jgi:hypothetical protein
MSEQISITIMPSALHTDILDASDAFGQLVDCVNLLQTEHGVSWKIVKATKQSPFNTVFEAFSLEHTEQVVLLKAKEIKERFEQNIISLVEGKMPFEWSSKSKLQIVANLLKRVQNGIGRFDVDFCDGLPSLNITPYIAKRAYSKIMSLKGDLKRTEIGTIDGNIIDISEHYNSPAIQIYDRLRSIPIWCVVPKDKIDIIAESNDWRDVWDKQRVRIKGQISYNKDGTISRVTLEKFTKVTPVKVDVGDIRDSSFTSGLSPAEYLDILRGETDEQA